MVFIAQDYEGKINLLIILQFDLQLFISYTAIKDHPCTRDQLAIKTTQIICQMIILHNNKPAVLDILTYKTTFI